MGAVVNTAQCTERLGSAPVLTCARIKGSCEQSWVPAAQSERSSGHDYTGYDFWLTKLNQFNGNFVNAEMVRPLLPPPNTASVRTVILPNKFAKRG